MTKMLKGPKVLAALMTVSVVGVLCIIMLYTAAMSYSQFKYAITIDAGSTHSKAILFRWKSNKRNGTGEIEEIDSCRIERGISTHVDNRAQAGDELMNCTANLTNRLDRATRIEHIFVYLGATAGMRMLNLSNPSASEGIFDAIRTRFNEAGLQTKRMSIITGVEEGLFAWVAVNAMSGRLLPDPGLNGTYGVLDMGGASAQIAHQISNGNKTDDMVRIGLYGNNYTVHTYSNFCFGTEQAMKRYLKSALIKHIESKNNSTLVDAPCMPRGIRIPSSRIRVSENVCISAKKEEPYSALSEYEFVGTSEYEKCKLEVDQMLNLQVCERNFRFCFKQSPHRKEGTFFAISAYYYLTDVLNIKTPLNSIDLNEYLRETRKICESSREQLQQDHRLDGHHRTKYCFQLTYLHSTLTNVYHFDEKTWPNLKFTNSIKGKYVGWVLGFMIAESNAVPSEHALADILLEPRLYAIAASTFVILFIVCAICLYKRIRKRSQLPVASLPMSQVA